MPSGTKWRAWIARQTGHPRLADAHCRASRPGSGRRRRLVHRRDVPGADPREHWRGQGVRGSRAGPGRWSAPARSAPWHAPLQQWFGRPPLSNRPRSVDHAAFAELRPSRWTLLVEAVDAALPRLLRLHAKRETDALANGGTCLGHPVRVVNLRLVIHDEE